MAYPYRGSQPTRDENKRSSYSSNPNRLSGGPVVNGNDSRTGLMRRFTTNALPTLSPIGQQRRAAAGEPQMSTAALNRVAPSERKIRHIESLLEQQRTINAELEKIDDQTRREVEDGLRHERAVSQMIAQSEPTTPPEYQDAVPNLASRPNRYSTNSLTSPPGITGRSNRSSAHLTSPPSGTIRPYTATASNLPSQSVPGSRRQSDDEDDSDFLYYDPGLHRSAANPNRNSMPITTYDRKRNEADLASTIGPLNTTSFLFDDDERPSALPNKSSTKTSPPDTKSYLKYTADGFPHLIRREDNGELVSGSSAALDLGSANAEQQATDRGTATRHRVSLPPTALSSNGTIAPLNSILAGTNDVKSAANNRRSVEVKFTAESKRPALMASPPNGMPNGTQKSQLSYSTNDIPTLKSIDGESSGGVPINSPSAQPSVLEESANHELTAANLHRNNSISTASNAQRQSQEFTNPPQSQQNFNLFINPAQSDLQANAPSFGPGVTQDGSQMHPVQASNMPYGQTPYYGAYGMPMLNNGFANMNLGSNFGGQGQWPNQMPSQIPGQMAPYQQAGYGAYQQYGQGTQAVAGAGRYNEPQRMQTQQRKAHAEEMYNSINIPDIPGQVYGLCKDQHGCRFLQRKLEERREEDLQLIFDEVKDHFQELMIDPFGNYLCQRLLEYANDDQRTALVKNAVPAMSKIALNQHGTRALQRMIEYISTPEQTSMIIDALRHDVVQLIQDLNGNHVIQKCLNHLTSLDAQFIFDAVGANCVVVGTHRHGCCVLQRCVDHASGLQKGAMVDHIIANAFELVQDPFGNYVVQYILDLTEPSFTEPLCRSFMGSIGYLSKQKFSSNVIEKCIRCAVPETRRMLIHEIMHSPEVEKMLRDSFANYVIQTSMDFADYETKCILVENCRPTLPSIRHTPHGRRIIGKVQDHDNGGVVADASANSRTPIQSTASPMSYPQRGPPGGRANRMGIIGAPPQWINGNGFGGAPNGFGGDIAAPAPQRNQAYNVLNGAQNYQNFQNLPTQQNQGFGGPGGPGFPGRGPYF